LAADYQLLTKKLGEFYDFAGKVVLLVGAGHGQLLDPSIEIRNLIAVDKDRDALKEFEKKIAADGRQRSVEVIHSEFEKVTSRADVVYFEFCLHEMADPFFSLEHAKTLAPEVVVFDHSPAAEWVFYGAEEDQVRRSSLAMKDFGIRRHSSFVTAQRFGDYSELVSKMSAQGPLAFQRIERYSGATNFVIPMICELALL